MGSIVTGICKKSYPQSANPKPFYELILQRGIETVNADKYHKEGIGFDTEIPYGKAPIQVSPELYEKLFKTGAFVPNAEYDFELGHDPKDVYNQWVVALRPVDPEVRKHYESALKSQG
ncbi:DUF1293 family protein [Vibrio sinaloensis]|uniref:DUF1293 family protein n=1 Tax=Photobacterium sp. (strain ATCC 43367) TaxID=379097 RepID=UPI0022B05153|nr:DUF1293 family protein [Vibrio sinaloensis]MCZ4294494.1 DUF1293 family protein [Vibrio sinaloensis]